MGGPGVAGRARRSTASQTAGFWGEFLQPAEENHGCGHAGDDVCVVLHGYCVCSVLCEAEPSRGTQAFGVPEEFTQPTQDPHGDRHSKHWFLNCCSAVIKME